MSVIKVPTSFNIDVEFEIPEFYRRLVALIIDWVILFFYLQICSAIMRSVQDNSTWFSSDEPSSYFAIQLLLIAPFFLYHLIQEITMNGQSVGKKIMSIRVISENGGRPSFSQFLIRWMVRDIWFIMLYSVAAANEIQGNHTEGLIIMLCVIAYFITDIVLVVSSKKGQRLGDILAKTIMIRTNARTRIEETVFQEVADSYTPQFPEIMKLSDKDINAIKSILETARKKGDFDMAANAAEKIKRHLNINTSLSPFDFLEILLKDYNYLSVK